MTDPTPDPNRQSSVPFAWLWRWWRREWRKTTEHWRRHAVRILLIVLVLLVVRGAANVWIGHQLNDEIARLETTYGSLSPRSLAPPRVPQAQNRARVVRAAASLVIFDNRLGTLDWYSRLSTQPSPQVAQQLEQLLADNRLAVQVAEVARRRPKSNWQIEYGYDEGNFPPLLDIRTLGTVLAVSCRADVQAGRADQAVEAALAGLAEAQSLGQEPNTLIQLIRVAIANEQFKCLRDLLDKEPSAPLLSDLADVLAASRTPDPMHTAFIGELKSGDARFARMEHGEPTGMAGPNAAWIAWVVRPLIRYGRLRFVRGVADVIEWQAVPPYARASSSGNRWPMPSPGEPRPKWWQMVRRFDETFTGRAGLMRAAESGYEYQSVLNGAELAVALRRFRIDRGVYPDTLAELAPQYVAKLPIDPFTGRPPEYQKQGAGFDLRAHRARPIQAGSSDERLYDWKIPR